MFIQLDNHLQHLSQPGSGRQVAGRLAAGHPETAVEPTATQQLEGRCASQTLLLKSRFGHLNGSDHIGSSQDWGLWKTVVMSRCSRKSFTRGELWGRAFSHCHKTSFRWMGFKRRHHYMCPVPWLRNACSEESPKAAGLSCQRWKAELYLLVAHQGAIQQRFCCLVGFPER